MVAALWLALGIVLEVQASPYDPHLPQKSPWFEGWYTRISDTPSGQSIGLIVGHYPKQKSLTDGEAYLALIVDEGKDKTTVVESNPKALSVLKRGKAVSSDPDDSEPDFEVSDADGAIRMKQEGKVQHISMAFPAKGFYFEANLTDPIPWGPGGESPEGWAGRLPFLGLHWFVYSLSSAATYSFTSPTGTVSGHGKAHQEKNWGESFPKAWTWGEGLQGVNRIAFAGGTAPVGPLKIPNQYLLGLRTAKLDWNFHPQDPSVYFVKNDACAGQLTLTALGPDKMVKLSIQASPEEASGMFKVQGPTVTGFKPDSVESYRATIKVEAYSGLLHNKLEETLEFKSSAIEFGGEAWKCSSATEVVRVLSSPPRPTTQARRVRKELRSLSAEQRERVFKAMDVLKMTSTQDGQKRYGSLFVSYDDLVAQHLQAAAVKNCDEAHLGQAFATYHRAFTLRFEEALLSVDKSIGALPYWDYNVEAASADPRKSEVWEWFGSSEGDPSEGYAVKDGRFGHWRVREAAHDISNITNPYGLLRSPWNVNPSRYITRYSLSCGSPTHFEASFWELCLKAPSYLEWYACIDPTVHTWAHSFLGGVWDTERNVSRVECFLTNAIGIPPAWGNDCLQCASNCTDPSEAQGNCSCRRSGDLRCLADKVLARQAPTYGDFADAWTSPNDPIFFFHHANVDRHLMTWQQRHKDKAPHYGFVQPSIPCKGHGLKDVVGAANPFEGSMLGLESHLTNADLIAADGLHAGPYTYDTLATRHSLRPQGPRPLSRPLSMPQALGALAAKLGPVSAK